MTAGRFALVLVTAAVLVQLPSRYKAAASQTGITVRPATAALQGGGSQQFSAYDLGTIPAKSVTTHAYGNDRTHAQLSETYLTPSLVASGSFKKLGSWRTDSIPWGQPLIVVGVNGRTLLVVATSHNTVYAFDADLPGTSPIWSVNIGPPWTGYPPASSGIDLYGGLGCLSTPVVDPATNILYASCNTGGTWKLYSYNLYDGSPYHAPATFSGTFHGVDLNAEPLSQRAALLLANGNIYTAFYGFENTGHRYYGWVVAHNATTLQEVAAVCTSCQASLGTYGGGVWMSGNGPAADVSGNIYLATGNGFQHTSTELDESFVKYSPALDVLDYATPANFADLDASDVDLDSGGVMLAGDYLMGGGKDGRWWSLNKAAMGHLEGGSPAIAQVFQACSVCSSEGLRAGEAVANNSLYVAGSGDSIVRYSHDGVAPFNTTAAARSLSTFAYPGASLAYSSAGGDTSTAILWAVTVSTGAFVVPQAATLRAFDAATLNEIWNSGNGADSLGPDSKFALPTVANGRVYVPTSANSIVLYGTTSAPVAVVPTPVTWSINPSIGSITPDGKYTAPSTISASSTVSVTATSLADPTQSFSATVTLNPPAVTPTPPPPPATPATLPTGLIGRWTFDAADSNGAQTFDKSGNSYTGTISGSVARTPGRAGEAYTFSSNGSINMAYAVQAELNKNLTLATWIKTTNSSRSEGIISKYDTALGYGYVLRTTAAGKMELEIGTYNAAVYGNKIATDVAKINDGQWHHVAVTISLNNNVSFYVDGVLSSVSPLKVTGVGSNYAFLFVGQAGYAPLGNYFNGSLDEVQIYNRALSSGEINGLYISNGTAAPPPPPPPPPPAPPPPLPPPPPSTGALPSGLIGRWTFDAADIRSAQAFDKSGNNYTGTISGSVTRTSGHLGDAFAFLNNGSINMAYAIQAELNKNLTLAAWIRTTNSSRTETFLSK